MHPDMDWRVVDATDMTDSFSVSEFDVVVEKATLDAFVANERSQWEVSDVAADTIHRVLKVRRIIGCDSGKNFSLCCYANWYTTINKFTGSQSRPQIRWPLLISLVCPASLQVGSSLIRSLGNHVIALEPEVYQNLILLRLPLYAKECYQWDVHEAKSIAETESSAIAYYFYAMEKGKELNLERLAIMGLYIRDEFASRVNQLELGPNLIKFCSLIKLAEATQMPKSKLDWQATR